jgi:2'-5' RNA ligase
LRALQREIQSIGFKASWPRMDTAHLTLRFLGDTDSGRIPGLTRAMAEAASGIAPFRLHAGGVGVFPSVKTARILWAGVKGETDRLADLHRGLGVSLLREGIQPEPGRFVPHLTLARLKGPADPSRILDMVGQYRDLRSESVLCEFMGLFASRLDRSGAVHTCLDQARFTGGVSDCPGASRS